MIGDRGPKKEFLFFQNGCRFGDEVSFCSECIFNCDNIEEKHMSKRDLEITRHHIVPSSRGGSDERCNIARVAHKEHDLYHQLFGNMLPDEIIEYLVKTFWKGQRHWLERG